MANEEHLLLLKKGVTTWNKWIAENESLKPELSWANLSDLNLSGINLSNANLSNVNFSGATLVGAKLNDSNLHKAILVGANLQEIDLYCADLRNVNFTEANLTDSILVGANLSGAVLKRAILVGATFFCANLRGADLSGADLTEAFLEDAELNKVNFDGAELCRVYIKNAVIDSNANIDYKWHQVSKILSENLTDKNFSGTELSEVNLSGAELEQANFSRANLSNTNIERANLIKANFCDAILSDAYLSQVQALGTDFTGATFTGACIEDWNINSETKLDNVKCEYIYLKSDGKERRPSSGYFAPREFTKLFQKALETVDLIFADGIDWKAFFESFQELQAEYGKENLSVQAFERKSAKAFVVRLEVLPEANKAEIECRIKELYEVKLNALEAIYRKELQAKDEQIIIYREQSANIMSIAKEMATRPIQNIIDVTAYSESKRESNFNLQNAKFSGGLVNADTVNAHQIGGNITNKGQEQPTGTKNSTTTTILILAANPKSTSALRLDEEVREIDAGLQRARKRELFDFKQRWAVRIQDVYQALLDFKPQIVHFSGHGTGEDGLALEDDMGNLKLVDTEALAQLFKLFSNTIECVVLNACYSQVQAEAVVKYIPYVVGMNKEIGDQAAIKFAAGFYNALGAGECVEFAYKLGCNVIELDGISEHLTPVLKKKQ